MKNAASVLRVASRNLRARPLLAATAALLAACSTPPEVTDSGADAGADASALDSATNNRDAARSDTATSDIATDSPSSADGSTIERDASGTDAPSELDAAASDGSAGMDASALDSSADALVADASAFDSAPDSRADSAPDALPDSAPDVTCPGAQQLCAMRCVDTQTDVLNCGACSVVCPAPPSGTVACIAGRCGIAPGSQTTQPAGSATPFALGQPTLAVTMLLATSGIYPTRGSFTLGSALGMVHVFGGNFAANGALPAQGQLLPIATNAALYSILGPTFGGDGRTNFAAPNLRDRLLVATGMGPGLPNAQLGVVFGNTSATLTVASMPGHSHLLMDGATRTSVTGRGDPVDLRAPSLPLTAWVATSGVFPSASSGTTSPFLGQIRWFAGDFVPTGGWVPADGRLLPIASNTALFSILSNRFGGDGTTTFAVPDLRGRAPVGTGAAIGLPTIALGQALGASSTALAPTQLPAHQHSLVGGGMTQSTGDGLPVNLYQPGLGITWLVATSGLFPTRDGDGSFDDTTPYLGELIAFAGDFAPRGFLKAEGQLVSIAMNSALFAVLGAAYGGDGRITFALPDLRGRAPVGTGSTTFAGTRSGAPSLTLVPANLPPHTHTY